MVMSLDVAVIADDLTGAADCGVQFVRAGYRTAVIFFDGETLSVPGEVDAVVVDTDSRSLDAGSARERVLAAGEALKDARIFYKKLDSTLRGPIAAELGAALEAGDRLRAVVAPAFPEAGRTTRSGVQLVRGEPVHHTELAGDPNTPVTEGHIPSLLDGLGPVAVLSVGDLGDEAALRAALEGTWIVADAETDAHLNTLVRSVSDPSEVLWAGSAGLALALGNTYPGPNSGEPRGRPSVASHALVVIGSVSEVSREQLRRLETEPDITAVPLDSRLFVEEPGRASGDVFEAAREALETGSSVALYSTAERAAGAADRISGGLADVVAGLSGAGLVRALVLTGGDTAVRIARGLGARGILIEDELEAGVPVGTLIGPNPYPVITKAGGFGAHETLLHALRVLTRGGERP
ncbi:MAG: four-carbon acid sugar kinase family protein [Rubrobacteraceae bacterium]